MTCGKHYIYIWKESKFGLPFYVGQGRHSNYPITNKKRYLRSYVTHYTKNKNLAYCQYVANKIKKDTGIEHYVEIIYDNLSLECVNEIETTLIKRLGRRDNGTGILCNLTAGGELNPMDDPKIKEKHKNIMKTKDYLSKQHCKSIMFNDVEYYSKKELARHLGISSQLLNYRLGNNIPLDFKPFKGNKFK